MDGSERAVLAVLHTINGIGQKGLWQIHNYFGSFASAYSADTAKWRQAGFLPEVIESVLTSRGRINPENYIDYLEGQNIKLVCFVEEDYPYWLKQIPGPPYVLYYKGDLQLLEPSCIAVVGSRNATPYGLSVARDFSSQLARESFTVVSGMAKGVDSAAHRGALEVNGGTAAVLGSGLQVIYPAENKKLFAQIAESGLVLTEYSSDAKPFPSNFPMRNRIISGLSRGVLVVEAQEKSGALITADMALEQGRDVFAVPGPITSRHSAGTNNLIKQGAKLVSTVEDITEEYLETPLCPTNYQQRDVLQLADKYEEMIIQYMDYGPHHFEELLNHSGQNIGDLSGTLLNLEMKGMVKSLPGNYYVKIM